MAKKAPLPVKNDVHVIKKKNMGRPKGSKDGTTPQAFVNRFKGKTMTNISRLLDQGDRETTLKCMTKPTRTVEQAAEELYSVPYVKFSLGSTSILQDPWI